MHKFATPLGFSAIAMWALLALFTSLTQGIGPFQLLSLTFGIGGFVGLIVLLLKGKTALKKLRQSPKVWLLGVGGLFGYHFFYFTALSNAPVADASLIAYLWPLLIVLFSALLPNERLRWFHILGATMGLLGAGLLVAGKGEFSFSGQFTGGYLAALACALIWSGYSVLNRTQGDVPSEAVAGFCLLTAFFGLLAHLGYENWITPNATQWGAILALGLGPVGAAFYAWDFATKHGDIRILGISSYAAPLLSTLILVAMGQAPATINLAFACFLIASGAVIGSLDMLRRKTHPVTGE